MDQLKTDQLCSELCELYEHPNAFSRDSEIGKLILQKKDELLQHIVSQKQR